MQIRQGNVLQTLRGVQTFLDAHADVLGAVVTSGARRKLDAQVAVLDTHVQVQGGDALAAKEATLSQYAARQVLLHDYMAPIARIAAADLPPSPALQPLRMPKGRLSTEMLYAAAIAMADEAERHSATFIAALLPVDFVAQLRAAAAAMRVPLDERAQRRGTKKGATASLATEVSNARRTVKVIDAAVRVALKNDQTLLVNWNAVRRTQVKPGTPAGTTVTGAPATPAPTAGTSALPTPVTAQA